MQGIKYLVMCGSTRIKLPWKQWKVTFHTSCTHQIYVCWMNMQTHVFCRNVQQQYWIWFGSSKLYILQSFLWEHAQCNKYFKEDNNCCLRFIICSASSERSFTLLYKATRSIPQAMSYISWAPVHLLISQFNILAHIFSI